MSSNKPIFGSQLAGDVLEGLKDQSDNTVSALQDLVTGKNSVDGKSDSAMPAGGQGIEQLVGPAANSPTHMQAGRQGLTPQQLAEKEAGRKKEIEFHQDRLKEYEETHKQLEAEEKTKADEEAKAEKAAEDQKIIELREEEAKAAILNPVKAGIKPGRGTALLPIQKQYQGTGELSKTPTN